MLCDPPRPGWRPRCSAIGSGEFRVERPQGQLTESGRARAVAHNTQPNGRGLGFVTRAQRYRTGPRCAERTQSRELYGATVVFSSLRGLPGSVTARCLQQCNFHVEHYVCSCRKRGLSRASAQLCATLF